MDLRGGNAGAAGCVAGSEQDIDQMLNRDIDFDDGFGNFSQYGMTELGNFQHPGHRSVLVDEF